MLSIFYGTALDKNGSGSIRFDNGLAVVETIRTYEPVVFVSVAVITPSDVATPFPPLNSKNIGKV